MNCSLCGKETDPATPLPTICDGCLLTEDRNSVRCPSEGHATAQATGLRTCLSPRGHESEGQPGETGTLLSEIERLQSIENAALKAASIYEAEIERLRAGLERIEVFAKGGTSRKIIAEYARTLRLPITAGATSQSPR